MGSSLLRTWVLIIAIAVPASASGVPLIAPSLYLDKNSPKSNGSVSTVSHSSSALSSRSKRSTGILQGTVEDVNGDALPSVQITAESSFGITRSVATDENGFYQLVALPVGRYRITGQLRGFRTQFIENISVEIGSTSVLNLQLNVGDVSEEIKVDLDASFVDLESISVGKVVNERTVQEIPLNGRYFIDLGLLVPGSVTPPQNGLFAAPTRGGGSLGFNTAGNREDSVNFQINGITLNDQVNNSLGFNPPLGSVREFKIENSTFSAENGRNSGAVVSIATRSGTNKFHGELYEYLRNDALDARNFFNLSSADPPPFKRNLFGGSLSGPLVFPRFGESGEAIWNGKKSSYFFFTYETLQQRQGVDVNTPVLSDAQRESVTDPVVNRLVQFLPRGNIIDANGVARFSGSTRASADVRQWTLDISHNFSENDRLHAYFVNHDATRNEPTIFGTTIPGFGEVRVSDRQVLTLSESHVFAPNLVNEVRFGMAKNNIDAVPAAGINPASIGINIGVDEPIGLPQLNVSGGFNFGGPSRLPQRRAATTLIFGDTFSYSRGKHSLRFGGEYRAFDNQNVIRDTGSFNFPSAAAFIAGNANSFTLTRGELTNSIKLAAVGVFIHDSFKWKRNVTLDLGLRYDLSQPPKEENDRFIVFDVASVSLLRVGRDLEKIWRTEFTNFQPRVGIAWDPFKDGKTSVRAGYGIYIEQPVTAAVAQTSVNPPLATPLSFTGTIRLDNAINLASAAGLAPVTVDPDFKNANVQSWNLNVQRELISNIAIMAGYFGSKGTHLRISRNINQPTNGVRPFPRLSISSPELPATQLGNIVQIEGTGNSNYNALWTSLDKRFSRGLQLNVSYTWSKSIDYNSTGSPAPTVTLQNSYDIRNDRGLSDFDARHRFVLSSIYELPFVGNRFVEGWQLGIVFQTQTGNPLNLVTSTSAINGVANTIRPDSTGPIELTRHVDRWFDTSELIAVPRFGNLGRNVVIGPCFGNVDLSLLKNIELHDKFRIQLRAEFFDLFNNVNFGQPGRVVGSSNFGQITNTRFPTGDSGSSRQVQFALKLAF